MVILLDRRTQKIQQKVRKLIAGKDRFLLAVAQEEIEAWWLGDRTNTLGWLGFRGPPVGTRYAADKYLAERDDNPKRTLTELTEKSSRLDRVYGEGNLDLGARLCRNLGRQSPFEGNRIAVSATVSAFLWGDSTGISPNQIARRSTRPRGVPLKRNMQTLLNIVDAGGLDALKILGKPADILRETKGRMFAA